MKIIGLLTAWACEDWIELKIQQALSIVDELIISIGAFHKYFKPIEDKTYARAKKYLNNKKIRIVKTYCDPRKTPDQNKCATLNLMLKASENIDIGNILWILDADEFYSKESIEEILNYIQYNDFDLIYVKNRMFCINLNYYIMFRHERIIKIKDKNCFFTPIQNINPKPKKIITLLENHPMFHYSLLMGEQMKGIQWMLEGFPEAILWYRRIYENYDPENEELWKKRNQQLTGHYGFWRSKEEIIEYKIGENEEHGLFRYNGYHPEIIENSDLRKVMDFRKYMKKKSNYSTYLETMKKIISKKKKLTFRIVLKEKVEYIRTKGVYVKFRRSLIRFTKNFKFLRILTKFLIHKISY